MNFRIKSTTFFVSFIFLISCSNIGNECPDIVTIDTEKITPLDREFEKILENYNSNSISNNDQKVDKYNNIFIDLSDGVTKFALSNSNNRSLFQTFLMSVSNENNNNYYYELSNDELVPYTNESYVDYFLDSGHKDSVGNYKMGAPLDDAINKIADENRVSVLVTDGELYDKNTKKISVEMWASKALTKWFNAGNKLSVIYSDFNENNNGKIYRKHMYLWWFIPKEYTGNLYSNFISDLNFNQNLKYNKLDFSTNPNNLFTRKYVNSQEPGTTRYTEQFNAPAAFISKNNFEYIDLTDATFNVDQSDEASIVNVIREGIDEDTGKKNNYPLLEKLFFNFNKFENYQIDDLSIKVTNITTDFKSFKRNYYAKNNLPKILKTNDGKDSLDIDNYLVFNPCITFVDDEIPYDLINKTQNDTVNRFSSMLKDDFKFPMTNAVTKQLYDFLILDQTAGKVNEINDDNSEYEIVIKFSDKFTNETLGFSADENNLVRVDILIDDLKLKPLNYNDLTWNKISEDGIDETFFRSLTNTLKNNAPINKIIYTYYLEFGPFNY